MTFVDARTLPKNQRIEADVCVVGSGAAGLAIAKSFLGTSVKVAVLESGGEQPDEETQDLYRGDSVGQRHSPLRACRLRYYGGTTNHWSAHVRTLDAIDFERRPWVMDSGWPLVLDDLRPYYDQARRFLGLPEKPFQPADWVSPERQPWAFEDARIRNRVRRVIPERNRRLGPIMRDELASSTNVRVYLHANVLRIVLSEARKEVRRLELATLDGKRHVAHARAFVLATGGIENPRILLLSDIGTSPDPDKNLVGRYFANHPEVSLAKVQLGSKWPGSYFYQACLHEAANAAPFLSPSRATQRQFKLLNTWLQVRKIRPNENSYAPDGRIAALALDMDALGNHDDAKSEGPGDKLRLTAVTEQAPNPQSRVFLGKGRDRFDQQRAVLDWKLSELDTRSAHAMIRIVTREMGIVGLGRVKPVFPKKGMSAVDARGSFHHMGTTRMHQDPRRGVLSFSWNLEPFRWG